MSVYVDSLRVFPGAIGFWRGKRSCHLVADTEKELHEFAAALGMKRVWFQNESSLPHYDLTAARRSKAVEHGAIEITRKEIVERIRRARNG